MVRMEWDGEKSVHVRTYVCTLYILVQQSKVKNVAERTFFRRP